MSLTDSTTAAVTPSPQYRWQQRQSLSRQVQSVFSEVLASVGVEGYRSAVSPSGGSTSDGTADVEPPLGEQAADAWNDWYELEQMGRYRSLATSPDIEAKQVKQEFGNILTRAYSEGGYADPKQFLSTLSPNEMESIRLVHSLANSVNVSSLTNEGALNLLIPSIAQVDMNGDGLTQSGAAYGIQFPDSRTPADVVAAWEESTAGLSPSEKSLYVLQVKLPVLMANIKLNADGTFSHQFEPGDPEFTNPMADQKYSYAQAARDQVNYLDAFRNQIDPIRYQRDRAFWSDFASRLNRSV